MIIITILVYLLYSHIFNIFDFYKNHIFEMCAIFQIFEMCEIFKLFELPEGTIHLSQKTTNSMPILQNSKIHTIAKITKN